MISEHAVLMPGRIKGHLKDHISFGKVGVSGSSCTVRSRSAVKTAFCCRVDKGSINIIFILHAASRRNEPLIAKQLALMKELHAVIAKQICGL